VVATLCEQVQCCRANEILPTQRNKLTWPRGISSQKNLLDNFHHYHLLSKKSKYFYFYNVFNTVTFTLLFYHLFEHCYALLFFSVMEALLNILMMVMMVMMMMLLLVVFTKELLVLCSGPTVCRGCRQKVGLEIEYKQGSRKFGYSLIKDNVMWRYDNETEYRPVKKWSAVPFPIEEEKLFPGS